MINMHEHVVRKVLYVVKKLRSAGRGGAFMFRFGLAQASGKSLNVKGSEVQEPCEETEKASH